MKILLVLFSDVVIAFCVLRSLLMAFGINLLDQDVKQLNKKILWSVFSYMIFVLIFLLSTSDLEVLKQIGIAPPVVVLFHFMWVNHYVPKSILRRPSAITPTTYLKMKSGLFILFGLAWMLLQTVMIFTI